MASRVTEVFGWDEKALMLGIQQATLFDSDHGGSPAKKNRKKETSSAATKKTSLNDFF